MKVTEIKSLFIEYFVQQHRHVWVESSSLVPQNDPSLLFTNAGMVQFKDFFLGKQESAMSRAVSCQRCVRVGGKHNDLENVGKTSRHHTFFEMLGNFSFGDYFKEEAIGMAWSFVTEKLAFPKERLFVSIYEKDEQAAQIWLSQRGFLSDHLCRLGEKDNFWAMGETGPCGPCTEIFLDRGIKYGCGRPECGVGCDCDRFLEFWNLVFMQYERLEDGRLVDLPKPSVDTGAGVERLAALLQGADTNYDIDLFQEIIHHIQRILPKKLSSSESNTVALRVIADHIRAITFLIADGVFPSHEGRGYVLRRIIRRAIRFGQKLGWKEPFLYQLVEGVVLQMGQFYLDLASKKTLIEKVIFAEEEQFLRTLTRGLTLLTERTEHVQLGGVLEGAVAFKLYDTYGFPLDLTQLICEERGLGVDVDGFHQEMQKQKQTSRQHWKGSGDQSVQGGYFELMEEMKREGHQQVFYGYEVLELEAECFAIFVVEADGLRRTGSFHVGRATETEIEVVFLKTPFYGESGGQEGDRGFVVRGEDFHGEVLDVQKPFPGLSVVRLKPVFGEILVGEVYLQKIDAVRRKVTAKNHTATHLLHQALKTILGDHVRQAGSLVTPEWLRFDFTHFQAMQASELEHVENWVNEKLWLGESVITQEMEKEAAIAHGAQAIFGEKYGETVRVVDIGDFSSELCGGTHVNHLFEIHLFKIAHEHGVAAGVRRILAYTAQGAFDYLRQRENQLKQVSDYLKLSSPLELMNKVQKMVDHERSVRQELSQWQQKSLQMEIQSLCAGAKHQGSFQWIVALCPWHAEGIQQLRLMVEGLKQKIPMGWFVLGMADERHSKAYLVTAQGPQAPKGFHAHEWIQDFALLIEGRGGGKSDFAQAGGMKPQGMSGALEAAKKRIQSCVNAELEVKGLTESVDELHPR